MPVSLPSKPQVKSVSPKRREFKVPHEFKQKFDFLAMYKVLKETTVVYVFSIT